MNTEIEELIVALTIKTIEIKLFEKKQVGYIINEDIVLEILKDIIDNKKQIHATR